MSIYRYIVDICFRYIDIIDTFNGESMAALRALFMIIVVLLFAVL